MVWQRKSVHLGGGWGIIATREDDLTAVCWRLSLYHNSIQHHGPLGFAGKSRDGVCEGSVGSTESSVWVCVVYGSVFVNRIQCGGAVLSMEVVSTLSQTRHTARSVT